MTVQPKCPRCGAELPAEAPQGICPQCLLAVAMPGREDSQSASAHSGELATESFVVEEEGPRRGVRRAAELPEPGGVFGH